MDDKSDPDYYPRIKINKRWYLAVPELRVGTHTGCAFERPNVDESDYESASCTLCPSANSSPPALNDWRRWDCGHYNTIFVAPSKFQKYLSDRVSIRMNEGDADA